MAKNNDDTRDDKVEEQREAPVSVRDSIRAAMEEHAQDSDRSEDRQPKNDKDEISKVESDDSDKLSRDVKSETKERVEDQKIVEVKEEKEEKVEKVAEESKQEVKAPSILPKSIQNIWANLPEDAKQDFNKTQKDLADAKAENGRLKQQQKDWDAVTVPYAQALNQWGVTGPQLHGRLMQWMEALTGQDKWNAIHELANNFGMDIAGEYQRHYQSGQTQTEQDHTKTQEQQYVQTDPRLLEAVQTIASRVYGLEGGIQEQKQKNAANYVETWAGLQPDGSYKNKPYFPQVRQLMFSLLSSGAVPLVNGQLDLDTAYENACYSNSEVRQLLLAQQEQDKQNKAIEARNRKVAEDRTKLNKAKSLNLSLKPSSPSNNISSDSNGRVRNKDTGQYVSVRDSIRQSISELNN